MANETVTTTTALVGLSGQLNTVRTEISATNVSLQNVASLIQLDSSLDQRKLLQEREQERLLAEREVRVGQEQELQRKVSAAVTQPVNRIEKKLTSTFDNITSSLKFLFTGFVGTTVLKGLGGASKLGLKTLSGIGGLLKNSFGVIGSGLSALSGGFGSVIRSITGITGKISKAILSLATSPFKAIADVFKKFVPGIKPTAAGGAAAGAGGLDLLKLLKTGGRVLGGASAVQSAVEGDTLGAITSGAAAAFPNPLTITTALGYQGYKAFGENIDMSKFLPKGTPSLPNVDFGNMLGEMGKTMSNFFGINLDVPGQEVKGNVEDGTKPSEVKGKVSSQASGSNQKSVVPIQTVPFKPPAKSEKPNLNALSEPKPDIIYTTTGQQSQSSAVSGEPETITDVPLIPSSNPDNFYTLYAQINYNVVM